MRDGWVGVILSGADDESLLAEARAELAAVPPERVAACAEAIAEILATTRPDRPLTVDHQRALDGAIGRTTERVPRIDQHVAALRAKVWSHPQLLAMATWMRRLTGALGRGDGGH